MAEENQDVQPYCSPYRTTERMCEYEGSAWKHSKQPERFFPFLRCMLAVDFEHPMDPRLRNFYAIEGKKLAKFASGLLQNPNLNWRRKYEIACRISFEIYPRPGYPSERSESAEQRFPSRFCCACCAQSSTQGVIPVLHQARCGAPACIVKQKEIPKNEYWKLSSIADTLNFLENLIKEETK